MLLLEGLRIMRHLRLFGLISIAMLALFAVPTAAGAQSPVQDQYAPAPDAADSDPADDSGGGDALPTAGSESDTAPVDVQAADTGGKLPFTGGSVPFVALIGLMLLAGGLVGVAATRKRRTPGRL